MNKPKRKIVSETGKVAWIFETQKLISNIKTICIVKNVLNYFIVKKIERPQTHSIFYLTMS